MPIDLSKTGLADKFQAAGVSLRKRDLGGVRAAVYLVIDRSRSMRGYFRDGSVQALAEQVLALSAHLDDDGIVPTILFGSNVHTPVDLSVHAFDGAIDALHELLGGVNTMGSTNYAAAMQTVINLHGNNPTPALVVFQTDGGPDSKSEAERVLCAAARLPIFWQFIGFGDDEFKFLRKLDELKVPKYRVIDNAGFFPAGPAPKSIPDGALYDALIHEFPEWLAEARLAGIVR